MATDDTPKAKLTVVEGLDEDEIEFQKLRRDLPGVKGASAIGIVSINVSRKPEANEFFRTHPDFMPVVPIVNIEVGMERQFFVGREENFAVPGQVKRDGQEGVAKEQREDT